MEKVQKRFRIFKLRFNYKFFPFYSQRSYDEQLEHENHVTDERNANYGPSPSPQYAPNNHYAYEVKKKI